jgi:hypothetical protein
MMDLSQAREASVSTVDDQAWQAQPGIRQWQLFQRAFDNLPMGFAVVETSQLRVLWANQAFCTNLGHQPENPAESAPFKPLRELVPQLEESGLAEVLRRVSSSGQACSDLEYEYDDFAHGPSYWRFSLRPLAADPGEAAELLIQVEDITGEVIGRKSKEQRWARVRVRTAEELTSAEPAPGAESLQPATPDSLRRGSWQYQ